MATASANRKLEDIITCCLCFEKYDTIAILPKALPCLHTFYAPCLDKHIRAVDENGQEPRCPKCQREFSIPKGGATGLPTNFSVQDMIDLNLHEKQPQNTLSKSREDPKHSLCKEHIDRHVIMVCMDCETGLCIDCMKTLNKSKHKEHTLEDFETYLSKYEEAIKELKAHSDELPELYDKAKKTADKKLSDTKREREREIDQQATRAIQEVKRWQRAQKNVSDFIYKLTIDGRCSERDVTNNDITKVISDAKVLYNSKSEKLPSITATKIMMSTMTTMKERCRRLSSRAYYKPMIQPLVIGKQNDAAKYS